MLDDILAKAFTIFAQVMVKVQPIWDKYKLLISLVLGILVGWIIIGWGLFPVQWENASPAHLRDDYKAYYLTQVAEDYAYTNDALMAQRRLGLDLEKNRNLPWTINEQNLIQDIDMAIQRAGDFGLAEKVPLLENMKANLNQIREAQPPGGAEEEQPTGGLGGIIKALAAVVVVLLVVGGALFGIYRLTRGQREAEAGDEQLIAISEPGAPGVAPQAPLAPGETPPVKSFTTTYVLGDDYFDPSFSIEIGPDFLGECGIGVSETLGAGDPKKVTAFEAWLFDKSDIRTVTTVLASDYAANDDDLRSKLEPKGEIRLLKPGQEITLETTALRVKARITELEYAQGNLPNHSFVQKVSFELQAWVKPGSQPDPDTI